MNKEIKYVFFGTPKFAEIVLKELLAGGILPLALVANPDKPQGRKRILTFPPTKNLIIAKSLHIPIFQPDKLDDAFRKNLEKLGADLFIIAAYSKILPREILEIPKIMSLGVHPSLLPKFRGTSPIQGSILEGESITGVTLYKMDEKMDHGPVLAQKEFELNGKETYLSLQESLAYLAGEMLCELLPKIESVTPLPQNHDLATITKKISADDAFLSEELLKNAKEGGENSIEKIWRMVRALNPEPGVWTWGKFLPTSIGVKPDHRVKILDIEFPSSKLKIKKIQEEGKLPRSI